MRICIVGWYGHKDFYQLLYNSNFDVTVISHNPKNNYAPLSDVVNIDNVGLEFGAYDYFLKNVWKEGSVLFLHDDYYITNLECLEAISRLKHDCAYIFRDEAEEKANGGKHGRGIFCSEKFLSFVLGYRCKCSWMKGKIDKHNSDNPLPSLGSYHRGFWFDSNNKGHVSGKPPIGVRHYNEAIYHFHWFLGRVRDQRCGDEKFWPWPRDKMDVVNRVYVNGMMAARRNKWVHIERERKKYAV